jgi:hypothetical protein
MNVANFDYESWAFTPDDHWTMKWRVGARLAYIYYDSILGQSPETAAGGTGILQERATNMFSAIGPHASVELTRQLATPEWQFLTRLDFASLFGRVKQDASETALSPGSPSGVAWGETPLSTSQTSPAVNYLAGLNYHPERWPNVDAFLGYQFEYWWNVGRLSLEQGYLRSRGDLMMQGMLLRVQFNY